MMGLLSGSRESLVKGKSRRTSNASGNAPSESDVDGNPNDTSTLDKEEGNVIMSIIAQRERRSCGSLRDFADEQSGPVWT